MSSDEPASSKPAPSRLKRWLHEPLLHVLLIGLALFAVYGALNPDAGQRQDANRIVITADDLAQIQLNWMAQWQRAPSPDEMRSLLDGKIREEILAREAMALGLDKDDTIVKRRMAQKMEFLMEDVSALREPPDDELRFWFEQNPQRFALPGLVSFRHLYFSSDLRGERARDAAADALQKLAGKPEQPPGLEGLADPFMFQDFYAERSPDQIAGIFGTIFAQSLLGLKEGKWQGPIESGLGWHLVWIEAMTPGRVPTFEEVEAAVKSEWIDQQRVESKRKMFDSMIARFQIVLPEATAAARPGGAMARVRASSP
jgi:peptidyl-prolyl cis-trans isomerase C